MNSLLPNVVSKENDDFSITYTRLSDYYIGLQLVFTKPCRFGAAALARWIHSTLGRRAAALYDSTTLMLLSIYMPEDSHTEAQLQAILHYVREMK